MLSGYDDLVNDVYIMNNIYDVMMLTVLFLLSFSPSSPSFNPLITRSHNRFYLIGQIWITAI